jgi:diaminopropionate ammonia-lyase
MTKHDPGSLRADLAALWPDYRPTPLLELPTLAAQTGVGRILAKIEGERPLGNFKSLGGTLAGLRALAWASGAGSIAQLLSRRGLPDGLPRLLCASDGNHGLSVAAAARRAGSAATVFLPESVDPARIARIQALGGEVRLVVGTYDQAVLEARAAAARGEGLLIPDTTQNVTDPVVADVMDGYSVMTSELVEQFRAMGTRPTHAFVQAGVGGLAAAVAQGLADQPMQLVVVEPASAPCVARALECGKPILIEGGLETVADMLSCGLASAPALNILLRHRAASTLVDEIALHAATTTLRQMGVPTTPSGAAGFAGLMQVAANDDLRRSHGLGASSVVLLIISEGAAAAANATENS